MSETNELPKPRRKRGKPVWIADETHAQLEQVARAKGGTLQLHANRACRAYCKRLLAVRLETRTEVQDG